MICLGFLIVLLFFIVDVVCGFAPLSQQTILQPQIHESSSIDHLQQASSLFMMNRLQDAGAIEPLSSFLTAVETFDGSSIVDPVVVSNVFWSALKGKFLAIIIGQFLASLAFAFITYVLSKQLTSLARFISEKLFKQNVQKGFDDTFVKSVKTLQTPTVTPDIGKLLICLTIDILGTSSELIPFVGELTDIAYAPAAALALRSLFQGSNVVFALEFLEEILPFTDILPLATICWVIETYFGDSDIARTLQIGVYNNNNRIEFEEKGFVEQDEKRYDFGRDDMSNNKRQSVIDVDVVKENSTRLGGGNDSLLGGGRDD